MQRTNLCQSSSKGHLGGHEQVTNLSYPKELEIYVGCKQRPPRLASQPYSNHSLGYVILRVLLALRYLCVSFTYLAIYLFCIIFGCLLTDKLMLATGYMHNLQSDYRLLTIGSYWYWVRLLRI